MLIEIVSPGPISAADVSAGGGGRCGGAQGDFSAVLSGIYFPPRPSSAPASLKTAGGPAQDLEGGEPPALDESGEPEGDSQGEKAVERPLPERLRGASREAPGDDFPCAGFSAQWLEPLLPALPPEEQCAGIPAGIGRQEAGGPETGEFCGSLAQSIAENGAEEANWQGISGACAGGVAEQGPEAAVKEPFTDAAAKELLALSSTAPGEGAPPGGGAFAPEASAEGSLPGRDVPPRGEGPEENASASLPGKGLPEGASLKETAFPQDLARGGGDAGKGTGSAGVSGAYMEDAAEGASGAEGERLFMSPRREAAAEKTPLPGEAGPEEGPEGRSPEGGVSSRDEKAPPGNASAASLQSEGVPGEKPGNTPTLPVSPLQSGLPRHDFRDTLEQIFQRMDYLVREGGQELRLKLQPEFLGEVLIRMRRLRGVLSAEIITGHPAVKDLFEGQLDLLQRRFQQLNLDVERFDVLLKDGSQSGFTFEREPDGKEPQPHPGANYGLPDGEEARAAVYGFYEGDRRVDYLV